MISVVIPVRNGGEGLARVLDAIARQELASELEIVVVDSGSTDGSQELASSRGARVHQIDPSEFNHGGTRNLGAELARGEFVVFTVDDAEPVGERWLADLLAPLLDGDEQLAGTYSRQIARAQAPAFQRHYIDYRFGPEPRVQAASGPNELTPATTLFSNVSAAVPREVLRRFPLREDIMIAEDLEWCGRVLLAGYRVRYVPESVVRHSHDYTLTDLFRRYFDQGVAAEDTLHRGERSAADVRGEGFRYAREELAWLWREGHRGEIPGALAWEAARYTGYHLGTHHRALPLSLRRRLSRLPTYWN